MQRRAVMAGALACALLAPAPAQAWPRHYPQSYTQIVRAAEREGVLTIWSVTDTQNASALIEGFRRTYPRIRVEYREYQARALFDQFLAEASRGRGTADFLWSSAMDLQIKLVNDGYSQAYSSPERAYLPDWAVWKNEAWGTTAEPIVFAYNRRLLANARDLPQSHGELQHFLSANRQRLAGKVGTYDPAASAVGYLYLAQDKQVNRNTWDLVRTLGQSRVQLYPTTEAILGQLSSGKLAFAYNMIGSYAFRAQTGNPQIGVIVPKDYTLLMSRIALIPAAARHPNAARLFLDYLLSREGQSFLLAQHMAPVRNDMELPARMKVDAESGRAIRVGPTLLIHQDRLTRAKFLRDWSKALRGQ